LKKEFNDNTQLIKENLEKLEDTDEWISWSKT
jgi:hypothetical protein